MIHTTRVHNVTQARSHIQRINNSLHSWGKSPLVKMKKLKKKTKSLIQTLSVGHYMQEGSYCLLFVYFYLLKYIFSKSSQQFEHLLRKIEALKISCVILLSCDWLDFGFKVSPEVSVLSKRLNKGSDVFFGGGSV